MFKHQDLQIFGSKLYKYECGQRGFVMYCQLVIPLIIAAANEWKIITSVLLYMLDVYQPILLWALVRILINDIRFTVIDLVRKYKR